MKNNIINNYCLKDKSTRDQMWYRYPRLREELDSLEELNYCSVLKQDTCQIYSRLKELKPIKKKKKYFDDLIDGDSLGCMPVTLTKNDILSFAKAFDPQPFHIDESLAKKSIFKGLIASSLHTLSACTRVVSEALCNVAIISGVGMDEVKMYNPVRPDDILKVEAWWANLKRSNSRLNSGFATLKCKVINQKDEPVINYGYQLLISSENNN